MKELEGADISILQIEGLEHVSCPEENCFKSEILCVDTSADTTLSRKINRPSEKEAGGTPSEVTTDLHELFESMWDKLAHTRKILDAGGRESSVDCKQNKVVMYSAFPLCPQRNPDAMVSKSPLESPGTEDMYVVVKVDSAAGGRSNIITVDNSASPWTLNPNSMDSGKTVKVETLVGEKEKLLRVRQSSLKRRKGAKGDSARSEWVIWMYNREIVLDGSNNRKVEEDIWIGVVKKKQSTAGHPNLVTVDAPRKRCAPKSTAPPPAKVASAHHSEGALVHFKFAPSNSAPETQCQL